MRLLVFTKGKKYAVGEISEKTGLKKIAPGKWTAPDGGRGPSPREPGHQRALKEEGHYEEQFESAVYGHHMASYVVMDILGEEFGIDDYEQLRDSVRLNPDLASKIYRKVLDGLRSELKNEYGLPEQFTPEALENVSPAEMQLVRHAQKAAKELAEVLSHLKGGRKVRLMVSVDPKKVRGAKKGAGGKAYMYKDQLRADNPPVVRASVLKQAEEKLGGWTMKGPPNADQAKKLLPMLQTEKGAFKPDRAMEFVHKKNDPSKPIEIQIPFRAEEEGIMVAVRQAEHTKRGGGKRKKITAEGTLLVPYAVAVQFLTRNVPSRRARNEYLGQLRRSKGFQRFLDEHGVKLETGKVEPKRVVREGVA